MTGFHWRIPTSTQHRNGDRAPRAHLVPKASILKGRHYTRCGRSCVPGLTKPPAPGTPCCQACAEFETLHAQA